MSMIQAYIITLRITYINWKVNTNAYLIFEE